MVSKTFHHPPGPDPISVKLSSVLIWTTFSKLPILIDPDQMVNLGPWFHVESRSWVWAPDELSAWVSLETILMWSWSNTDPWHLIPCRLLMSFRLGSILKKPWNDPEMILKWSCGAPVKLLLIDDRQCYCLRIRSYEKIPKSNESPPLKDPDVILSDPEPILTKCWTWGFETWFDVGS